ncbi:hypothetical protein RJ640_020449 [Escallonia rubra]|uniref:Protein kinase domain-containing protein n=1 Tax=Escallonia rubra TaxID=112253 RepID=A0AA88QVY8_9ASTE|nr:hypothetical protein RJ640_020449 [Escallonia rubra]
MVEAGNMVILFQVLKNVMNNFSQENILGQGGFGTVYTGELHDEKKIVVKRMESRVIAEKGLAEFKSGIVVLIKVRHQHLCALLGCCLDGNEKLLVYENMPQGALNKHLFNLYDRVLGAVFYVGSFHLIAFHSEILNKHGRVLVQFNVINFSSQPPTQNSQTIPDRVDSKAVKPEQCSHGSNLFLVSYLSGSKKVHKKCHDSYLLGLSLEYGNLKV